MSGFSSSTATAGVLTASSYPATLTSTTGEETVFDFTGSGNLVRYTCGTMHLEGALAGSSSTFTLHPVFLACSWRKEKETPVPTSGCDFRFHVGATIGESGNYAGTVDLVCEAGKSLAFPAIGTCEVKIDPQEEFAAVEFINMPGAPSDFTIDWSLEGFQYTVVKDGLACPYPATGVREDGDFITPPTTVANPFGSSLKVEM